MPNSIRAKPNFRHLRVGDTVTRMLAGTIPMTMHVVEVLPDRLRCDAVPPFINDDQYWEFCRDTGAEIDEELGWGPAHGVTGSMLVLPESKDEDAWSKR